MDVPDGHVALWAVTRTGGPLAEELTYLDGQIATQRLEIDAITDAEERNPPLMAVAGLHHQRAMRTGEVEDVEDALLLVDAVLAVTPDDHPTRPGRLNFRALYVRERLVLLDDR